MNKNIDRENPLVQINLNTIKVMEENIRKEQTLKYTLYDGKNV